MMMRMMAASCVVSVLHLLRLARREALIVLIRRRGGGRRWLPAIVELWDIRWDVFWPGRPDRRTNALSHAVMTVPAAVHFYSLCPSLNQSLGCCGTWGCSSCLLARPTASSPRSWWSGRAVAGPPLSEAGRPQRVARSHGKEGPPAEGERAQIQMFAEVCVKQASGRESSPWPDH